MSIRHILLASLSAALVACSPYGPDLGETPFRCGTSDPRCPDGYECDTSQGATGVCVEAGTVLADGGPPDAEPSDAANVCAPAIDAEYEPNESYTGAYLLPGAPPYAITNLAICGGAVGDVDVFRFTTAQIFDVAARVEQTNRSRGELVLELLNGSGVPIATGAYDGGNANIDVMVANAPAGSYYVQVRGATADVVNGYGRLSITATP
jgi:hypothetical protein